MAAIVYASQQALSDIWYRRKLNLLILLALFAGLLLPLFSVGRLLGAYTSLRDSEWPLAHTVAVADVMHKFDGEPEMDQRFSRAAQTAQTVGYSATLRATAGWNGKNYAIQLSGMSMAFGKLEPMACQAGRLFSQEELTSSENVCLVKWNGRVGGAALGEVVQLGQEKYTVVGAVRDPYLYGDVIIPYGCMEPYAQGGALQYRALFGFDAPVDTLQAETLGQSLQAQDGMQLLDIRTAVEMCNEMKQSLWPVFAFEGVVSGGVLLFSVLGCILMFQGTIENSAAYIGVRLAFGGTRRIVLFQYLLQNFILVVCAAVLDVCALPLLETVMQSENSVPVSLLAGWYFILCVCVALLITLVGMRGVLRRPVAQLVRGNG